MAATLLLTGACSTMEALNPVSWFDDGGEATADRSAGGDSRYPNLASVPPRPVLPDITERKEALREGLIADTQNARYTDEVIRRDWSALTGRQLADNTGAVPDASTPPPVRATAPVAPSRPPMPTDMQSAMTAPSAQPVPPAPVMPARPFATPSAPPPVAAAEPRPAPEPEALAPAAGADTPAVVPPPPVRVVAPTAPEPQAAPVQTQLAARSPAPTRPAPPARAESLHVGTIYFPDGAAALDGDARAALGAIADAYRRAGGKIRVVGHSSIGIGTEETARGQLANMKVSLDRANAVAAELMRRGVPSSALEIDGAGAERPAYAEISQDSEAWNRRAEVYLVTDG